MLGQTWIWYITATKSTQFRVHECQWRTIFDTTFTGITTEHITFTYIIWNHNYLNNGKRFSRCIDYCIDDYTHSILMIWLIKFISCGVQFSRFVPWLLLYFVLYDHFNGMVWYNVGWYCLCSIFIYSLLNKIRTNLSFLF